MSRSASVKYDDFKSRGQSYSCSLVVETGNHHNVRLDSTAFTTTASNANGRYTIGNVTLRYTQHANYSFSTWASERPSGGRFGPYWQRADGSDGDLSVRTDTVYQDTVSGNSTDYLVCEAGVCGQFPRCSGKCIPYPECRLRRCCHSTGSTVQSGPQFYRMG